MGDILKGKVAVVTGSGQGIGRAIAIGLAKEGAKVVTNNRKPGSTGYAILNDNIINSLNQEQKEWLRKLEKEATGDAETTAKTIREIGGEAVPFFGDVSNFEVAGKLIKTAVDNFGKIDILVNAVGTFSFSPVWEMSEETWDHICLPKPKSHFNCIRHAAPFMMKQEWGRIINCTSTAFLGGILKCVNYCTANAGVVGLTRSVAKELYRYGITCNAFAPFAMTRASFELEAYDLAVTEDKSPILRRQYMVPVKDTPSADDLAPFITYLASDAAATISGTVFSLAGNSIGMFSEPEITRSLVKYSGQWTIDELVAQVPTVLLKGYRSPAASD